MGFQGSMVVTREPARDYVLLSTNQSKNLLSGGQMSCNKDAATFWTPIDNDTGESIVQEQKPPKELIYGKDMNEWIKEFVQNEFFRDNNNVDIVVKDTECAVIKSEDEKDDDNTQDLQIDENLIIDSQDNECIEDDEANDTKYSIIDESKSAKAKRNFKVFKFMKNALKRHIKK